MRLFLWMLVTLSAAAAASGCAGCTDPPPPDDGQTNNASNNGGGEVTCTVGERRCEDTETLATCVRSSNGSTRFVTTICLDTEQCQSGDCVEIPRTCEDTCTPPETRCTSEGQVESCSDHDGDGCVEFGSPQPCEAGQICDAADGLCRAPMCADACSEGSTACEESLLSTCVRSIEGCLDWGPAKECPEGQACMDGACVGSAGCEDECFEGERACTGDGMLRTCVRDADGDSCTEFADPQPCPVTETCRMGACVAETACQDQCLSGEQVCVGNDVARCEVNAEGCLEFSNPAPCPGPNESCQNSGGGAVMCAPVQMSGKVVINEVFYDALGDDTRGADGSPTFIELYGPPGLSLADYTVELVNGSGGAIYGTFDLPADAQLDGNGFAVLTTDVPDTFLSLALPFFTNVYPILTGSSGTNDAMQNGPDNVTLLDGSGTVVDAVGYGALEMIGWAGEGACATPATCESAPDPAPGRSIGRDAEGTDTDNNAADFTSYFPTPSLPNSDLLINEAYFDQPGADGSETFVELMAPILGWEDLSLDGYVLHAINGFDGEDYIFTLDGQGNPTLDGVVMDGWFLNDGFLNDYGYVVICNIDTASGNLIDLCTVPYEGVDLQNGPDNLVLRYEGRVIDALGYGTFGNETFVGEGSPAPFSAADSGKSLSRWPVFDVSRDLDTDDNASDFFKVSPTPGTDNELPAP